MLKYSTYQSIYDKPEQRPSLINMIKQSALGNKVLKIAVLLILLMVTGTGVVTAFASGNDSEKSKQTELTMIVVKPGDTLWEIASEHKQQGKDTRIYIEAIKRLNHLKSSSIQAGDTLLLPN